MRYKRQAVPLNREEGSKMENKLRIYTTSDFKIGDHVKVSGYENEIFTVFDIIPNREKLILIRQGNAAEYYCTDITENLDK